MHVCFITHIKQRPKFFQHILQWHLPEMKQNNNLPIFTLAV